MKRKIPLYFFFLIFFLIISTPVSQVPLDPDKSYSVAFSVGDKFEVQHYFLSDFTINNEQLWGHENETIPGIIEIITDPYFHPQVPKEEGEVFDYTLTTNGQTHYHIPHLIGWLMGLFFLTDMAYYSRILIRDALRGYDVEPWLMDLSQYWYGYFATNELSFYQSLIEEMNNINTTKLLDYFLFDDININYNDHIGNFSYGIHDDIFKIYSNETYYFTDSFNQTEKYDFLIDTQVNITYGIVEKQILYFKYTSDNSSFTIGDSFFNNVPLKNNLVKTSTSSTTSSTTYTSTSESPMINQIETNSPRFETRNLSTPNYVIYISALLIISLLRISYRKKS
ncbi:MAG: hypothetical protein VW394_03425 [Candidatus Heimdallarchaeota archaeon]